MKRCSILTSAALALAACVCTPAYASENGATPSATPNADAARRRKEAERHYDRAVQLHEDGDIKLALVEFRRAHELDPTWQVLFNIGTIHFQLEHYAEARSAFERYLAEGGTAIGAKRREHVEKELEALAIRTAYLSVTTNPPGAEILLDGQRVGRGPLQKLLVDAGPHTLTVSKPGYVTATETLSLVGGEERTSAVVVVEEPKAPIVTTEATGPRASTVMWIVTGALAAGTVGVAAYTLAQSAAADDNLAQTRSRPTTRAQLDVAAERVDTADRNVMLYTAVGGGLTLASAGVALYLSLSGQKSRSPISPITATVGPRFAGVSTAFTF